MEGFFMPENGPRQAFERWATGRHRSGCIGETMQTSRKTLGPATDQGIEMAFLTTGEVAFWLQVAPRRFGSGVKHAFRVADDLGPMIPVQPARVRAVDGSPGLGPGQIYVMRSGMVFHPPGARSWPRNGTTTWEGRW
jgi:hypothetical protein